MKKNVKITVLMSVYNTDFQLIKRALNSVLNQDFQDFELIVIDDGSEKDPENNLLKAKRSSLNALLNSEALLEI